MHFAVVFLSALLSVTSVSSAFKFVQRREGYAVEFLQARQTSANACTSICTPFDNSITDCSTPQCYCTTAIETSLQDCINCAVAASSTPDVITSAQNLTNLFEQACLGVNLPTPTIPSFLPANPSATAPATASTGSVTGQGGAASTSTDLLPFSTNSVLPTQKTIRPSDSSTTAAATPSTIKSSAARMEAGKMAMVGLGAAVALGLF